jgi:Transcriptional regulators
MIESLKNMLSIIRRLRRSHALLLSEKLAKYNLTDEQWVVLKTVKENQPVTQKVIVDLTNKDKSTLTRILDQLEKKKMLERSIALSDRRLFDLKITAKGDLICEEMLPVENEIYTKMLEGISDENIIYINTILAKFVSSIDEQLRKEI